MADSYKILNEEFSIQELMDFVSDLSRFHRIQGCDEIEKAGNYIKSIIESEDVLDVELKHYSYGIRHGSFGPVVGWWIKGGELRLIKPREELLHSFKDSRTLVAAHSPGGIVEAEVLHIGDGEDPSSYNKIDVEGKIILACGYAYIVYRQATQNGAAGVLIYRKTGIEDAVPYMGLFLTPEEAKESKAPALVISKKTANKLIKLIEKGEKPVVRITVNAGYREEAWIPVVTAKIGESESEIHLCAHYCHPAGTVNDNVSGAASLMELALSLARAIKNKRLDKPDKHSIRFLWVPEFAGTLAYMINDKPQVVFSVNLDMIGEEQQLAGSTINFVKPPPRLFHPYEAVIYYNLKNALSLSESFSSPRKALAYRFDIVPYEFGSDHDVYVQFNVPSIMINQWPDKFYHSDQDTIDKFDPQLAKIISTSIGSAIYMISKTGHEKEIQKLVKSYFYNYIGLELSATHKELFEARYKYIIKSIGSKVLSEVPDKTIKKLMEAIEEECESQSDKEKYVYKEPIGVLSSRLIYRRMGWEGYKALKEITEKEKFMRTVISSLIPLYMRNPISISRLAKMIEEDYGVKVKLDLLRKTIELLIKAKIIEKK
ncbi:MAG: DUF4910 domain-containing protein [archaeon GB-1867-005]|nr:DUF4910 domain-containing protein [Candidatus Culexmicrobium cathedralense]